MTFAAAVSVPLDSSAGVARLGKLQGEGKQPNFSGFCISKVLPSYKFN